MVMAMGTIQMLKEEMTVQLSKELRFMTKSVAMTLMVMVGHMITISMTVIQLNGMTLIMMDLVIIGTILNGTIPEYTVNS